MHELITALRHPACYPHPVREIRIVETHISWVLLTGDWAYKIKKPVNLGFLDFTGLEARRHYCAEELRLNRRFAPALYAAVVPIGGTPAAPRVGAGGGTVIEYAVKMREFPQEALASRLLDANALPAAQIDGLADTVASFHQGAAPAAAATPYGTPEAVAAPVAQNFEQMRRIIRCAADRNAIDAIEAWSRQTFKRLERRFQERRDGGSVRECHGDLHLGNVVRLDNRLVPFDCIEFNPALRWIDVLSEAAFLAMDVAHRGHSELAFRLLNRYLETTGDYAGLDVLPYYLVYRALVRAKIECIRGAQVDAQPASAAYRSYVALARQLMARRGTALIITHGLSGSGKTTLSQTVLESVGAFRVRSDVERKRLHGLAPLAASGAPVGGGIYSAGATAATYERLSRLARAILKAGFTVIVDAAFLKRAERDRFRALAAEEDVPFMILVCRAPDAVLRARVAGRAASAADASEAGVAVLEAQLATVEAPGTDELADTVGPQDSPGDVLRALAGRLGFDDAGSARK